ncbi:MAG: carboxypeptidase regulatory-like domain-containing protein [Candidatus Acidiferrales bacterium]
MKKAMIQFGVAAIGFALCIAFVLVCFAPPASAQEKNAVPNSPSSGTIKGTVKDEGGKPMEGVIITFRAEDGGLEITTTSDATGKYLKGGLAPGGYTVTFTFNGEIIYNGPTKVVAGHDMGINVSLADPDVKQFRERAKAYSEASKKNDTIKGHYESGHNALIQAQELRKQQLHAPADQRDSFAPKITPLATQAVTEFQQALELVGNNDEDRRSILGLLGDAYDTMGKYDDEAAALQKAAAIDPPAAGFYNNLGNALAKAGKIDEAKAAYLKSGELDPANAAQAYRNFGAVLYNTGGLGNPAMVEILKKATDGDPKNAQGWFLYGAALVANMQSKMEGDKITFIMLPGTVEAYQKCIELDPNGPLATLARQGLEELKAMGLGVDTKVKTKH